MVGEGAKDVADKGAKEGEKVKDYLQQKCKIPWIDNLRGRMHQGCHDDHHRKTDDEEGQQLTNKQTNKQTHKQTKEYILYYYQSMYILESTIFSCISHA